MNAQLPTTATAIGLGDQYRYWLGASGRRYLFTAIPVSSVDEYRKAVVVLAHKGRRRETRILWIGEIDRHGKRRGNRLLARPSRPNRAYIHLLAGGPDDRRAVIEDLETGFDVEARSA